MFVCFKVAEECNVRLNYISGPLVEILLSSSLFPPFLDVEFSQSQMLDFSQYDFDFEFLYGYVGAKVKDMILEVRSQIASLTQAFEEFF